MRDADSELLLEIVEKAKGSHAESVLPYYVWMTLLKSGRARESEEVLSKHPGVLRSLEEELLLFADEYHKVIRIIFFLIFSNIMHSLFRQTTSP